MSERAQATLRTQASDRSTARARAAPRRLLTVALAVLMLAGIAYGILRWLQPPPIAAERSTVVRRADIVWRTRVAGRIVPRKEVFVRSLVAGVLDEILVRPGDVVKRGDHLATVSIVADPVTLSEARAHVSLAERRLELAQRELDRVRPENKDLALAGREIALAEDKRNTANIELKFARERLQLVSKGATAEQGMRSTRVLATISGTVLAVPVSEGDMISDTNSYRDGTAVAVIADMTQLLFKGHVEEAYVGKLRIGMPVDIRVGAMEGVSLKGTLSWIAPRATIEVAGAPPQDSVAPLTASTSGTTRFEVWIDLVEPPPTVRAGYSAAAEFTLEARTGVPSIEERALRFAEDQTLADVLGADDRTQTRKVEVGLSDGLRIEVRSGLELGERVKYADVP